MNVIAVKNRLVSRHVTSLILSSFVPWVNGSKLDITKYFLPINGNIIL